MSTIETHGVMLWAMPRFHREIIAPKPPKLAADRKVAKPAEPEAPPPKDDAPPETRRMG